MSLDEFTEYVWMSQMSWDELNELKDEESEEKWENGEKSSKSTYRKVVEKHRHISRSTRSRFSCLIWKSCSSKNFVKVTKEVTKELIWRNIFW